MDQEIVNAVYADNLEEVTRLVAAHPETVNIAHEETGVTLLHHAAFKGHTAVASFLITQGALVNVQDASGHTPLHRACMGGKVGMVRHLLSLGADPTIPNHQGDTPLLVTIDGFQQKPNIVRSLVAKTVVRRTIDHKGHRGISAVWSAVYHNFEDALKMLVGAGADPTEPGGHQHYHAVYRGMTPLQLAKKKKYYGCVEILKVSHPIQHNPINPIVS